MALMERLQRDGQQFVGKQAMLARFIRQNYYKAAFMTVTELAKQVKISPATVVRFADALGYAGYPGLKHHLHQVVQDDLTGPDLFALHLTKEQSGVLLSLVRAEVENLSGLFSDVSLDDLNRVADLIVKAERVFVVGFRAESSLAQYFGYNLSKIHPDVNVVSNDSGIPFDQFATTRPGDVLVAICYPRYARNTIEVVDVARRAGCYVVAVTDMALSPVSKRADLALHVRAAVASFVDSFCAPQMLLTSLLVQVSGRDRHRTDAYLRRFEEMAKRERFFYSERQPR